MKNEQLIDSLVTLKNNGISYKYIAENSDIPTSSFYYYLRNNSFPYFARKQVTEFILKEFKEILEDE